MLSPSVVLVQHVHLATTSRPSSGASALAAAALYVAVTVAGLLAAPVFTGAASNRRLRLVLAGVLLGGELVISPEPGVVTDAVVALHLVAASIWVGGVLYLAYLSASAERRARLAAAVRRLSPWAIGSATALMTSGYILLRIDRVGLGSLGASSFGRIVIAKISLLVLAGGLGLVRRMRAEATALVGALGLAGVLIGVPAPVPVLTMAGPGLAVVRIPDAPAEAMLVTRLGPDIGAVRVLSSEGVRLVDRATDQAHQLAPGEAARVDLHGDVARLAVTSGLSTVQVSVHAEAPERPPADGAVTADPVGWLDYQLGRVLGIAAGGSPQAAPAAGCLPPSPRHEGQAVGVALRHRQTRHIAMLADSSSRAAALVGGLERSGVHRVPLQRAHWALVATDATRARSLLIRLAGRPWIRAVYLAPWLLDGRVLSLLATTRLPPLLVASSVDAMSPLADRYRADLATVADGVPPSIGGLVGYADAVAPGCVFSKQLTVYSASPVGFLPGVLDVGHDHGSDAGWFAGGTLVPVT